MCTQAYACVERIERIAWIQHYRDVCVCAMPVLCCAGMCAFIFGVARCMRFFMFLAMHVCVDGHTFLSSYVLNALHCVHVCALGDNRYFLGHHTLLKKSSEFLWLAALPYEMSLTFTSVSCLVTTIWRIDCKRREEHFKYHYFSYLK